MPDNTEEITLPSPGPIPGIPGHHAPGRYLVNWLTREITPIVDAIEHVADEIKPKKKGGAQPEPAPAEPAQTESKPEQAQ